MSEKDLVETNLSEEMLDVIFDGFNIVWEINFDKHTTEEEIYLKKSMISYWKEQLLKYGDFEKMREILQYLK